ncbi:metal-dependent hydrolase [Paenalcaligenes hominis]|uniref:metal-dependent hydrolase n=1 Tax=Paenalcaligenes hominis TaxID=643674 RepID=UPI003526245B
MDSLTQAVLGASISGAMLGRFHGRKAVIAGAVLATLPDLDVFIRYADPISSMTYHRGFSHSLIVLTAFSLLLAALWRGVKPDKRYGFLWLWSALWLTLVTHPLLDAFTSFGTQLWWPLTPTPASWSSIFIIDPLYTLPLTLGAFAALLFGVGARTQRWLNWGLILSSLYLAWTVGAKHWAEYRALAQLQTQGAPTAEHWSAAMPFNSLLWRVLTRDEHQHCEMVISLLDRAPSEFVCVEHNHYLTQALPKSDHIERLRWFTGDWVRFDPVDDLLVVTDIRLGAAMGLSSFRFVVAEQNLNDEWTLVSPYRWPGNSGWHLLQPVMKRIYQSNPPLALQDWLNQAQMGAAR